MSMPPFWLGTSPFCDPDPDDCEQTPGYVASGNTKSCMFGKKVQCVFKKDKFSGSALNNELKLMGSTDPRFSKEALKNYVPRFTWFGEAPLCRANTCDVYEANMLPVTNSLIGNGSQCLLGEKWLGIAPLFQEHLDNVKEGQRQCREYDLVNQKTWQAGLKMGSDIAKAVKAVAHAVTMTPDVESAVADIEDETLDKVLAAEPVDFKKQIKKNVNDLVDTVLPFKSGDFKISIKPKFKAIK